MAQRIVHEAITKTQYKGLPLLHNGFKEGIVNNLFRSYGDYYYGPDPASG